MTLLTLVNGQAPNSTAAIPFGPRNIGTLAANLAHRIPALGNRRELLAQASTAAVKDLIFKSIANTQITSPGSAITNRVMQIAIANPPEMEKLAQPDTPDQHAHQVTQCSQRAPKGRLNLLPGILLTQILIVVSAMPCLK